jgi:S1-C subfamily serine protease
MLPFVIDLIVVLAVVAGLIRGARRGFVFTLGAVIGGVVGAVTAFLVVPPLIALVPEQQWRIFIIFLSIVVLVVGGLSLGELLGLRWRRGVRKNLRGVDRFAGVLAGGIVSLVIVSLVGSTLTSLGIPLISPTVASSTVLQTIQRFTPTPVARALGELRGLLITQGIPQISEALGGIVAGPPPSINAGSPELTQAAQSVARVNGLAYACGQSQSGSAFVIAPDRLLTNAHVVAGVSEPIIELPGVGGRTGRIVYYDAQKDIALIAVDGLEVTPLALGATAARGAVVAVQGFPFGGPFASTGAEVADVGSLTIDSIDGSSQSPLEAYTLAADVNPGNSGGPVLTLDGAVIGMVFARAQSGADIGYAITMSELAPIIAAAASRTESVPSGNCTRG